MTERYPSDASLLALSEDQPTGVEYIPTGQSPYFLHFRRLIQRTLLALGRANDLRVYQDGDLTIGVRPGRCFIAGNIVSFAGATTITLSPDSTTTLWLDREGALQSSDLPDDRTACLPLAQITTDTHAITALDDLRGETFLHIPSAASLGISASTQRINEIIDGTDNTVAAASLNTLTAGAGSDADAYHRHLQSQQNEDGEAYFTLSNTSDHPSANIAIVLGLPNLLPDDLVLIPDTTHGFITQRYNGKTLTPVASLPCQFTHTGDLSASISSALIGAAPIDGTISRVILSHGTNIQSSQPADHVTAEVFVNGTALCTTHPAISSAAGTGFRSTARGHGTPAVIKTDGTQTVQRGDLLTLNLTRTVSGTITNEASHIAVLIVIRATQPE